MSNLTVDQTPSKWGAAPGTDEGAVLGINTTSKIGFYGKTPIAVQTLSSASSGGSTVAEVVEALAALGLVVDSEA